MSFWRILLLINFYCIILYSAGLFLPPNSAEDSFEGKGGIFPLQWLFPMDCSRIPSEFGYSCFTTNPIFIFGLLLKFKQLRICPNYQDLI